MSILFYRRDGGAAGPAPELPGYAVRLWSPGDQGAPLKGSRRFSNWVWWAFEALGVFSRPGFLELTIWCEDVLVHRLILSPRWARFPFMGPNDLQVGDVWTHSDHRGQGLARSALAIVQTLTDPEDRLWYLTEAGNLASMHLATAASFRPVGHGRRTALLGLAPFGRFVLDET